MSLRDQQGMFSLQRAAMRALAGSFPGPTQINSTHPIDCSWIESKQTLQKKLTQRSKSIPKCSRIPKQSQRLISHIVSYWESTNGFRFSKWCDLLTEAFPNHTRWRQKAQFPGWWIQHWSHYEHGEQACKKTRGNRASQGIERMREKKM
jgi:hypothetical protein